MAIDGWLIVSNLVKRTILKIEKRLLIKNSLVSNLVKRTILKIPIRLETQEH